MELAPLVNTFFFIKIYRPLIMMYTVGPVIGGQVSDIYHYFITEN